MDEMSRVRLNIDHKIVDSEVFVSPWFDGNLRSEGKVVRIVSGDKVIYELKEEE